MGRSARSGFSLLEVMVALGILALVLGFAADALISHFQAIQIQEQRMVASQNCRAILNEIRKLRDLGPVEEFPAPILAVWPDGTVTEDAKYVSLPLEKITVTYVDPEANPLQVVVTSEWENMKNRRARFVLGSSITDS